jgi:phosphoserine phosphatase
MKVICFDFDDVLCDGNLLYKIGKEFKYNLSSLVDVIELLESNKNPRRFYSVVKKTVSMGRGLKYEHLLETALSFKPMPGAYETLDELKKIGYKVVIVSADDRDVIVKFMKKHGMMKFVDYIYASELGVKNGELDGTISGDAIETEKTGALKLIKKMYKVTDRDIFYIGDGLTDLPILKMVHAGAVFCPNMLTQTEIFTDRDLKRKIENRNLFIIETKDLREVLELLP